jgi:hypothetical protein
MMISQKAAKTMAADVWASCADAHIRASRSSPLHCLAPSPDPSGINGLSTETSTLRVLPA